MRPCVRYLSFIVLSPLLLSVSQADTTSYIRQLAKDKPEVLIVPSGSKTQEEAQSLKVAILSFPKVDKDKSVRILTPAQAAAEANANPKAFMAKSRIFLLAQDELKEDLPHEVRSLLTLDPKAGAEEVSSINATNLVAQAGKTAFAVTAYAPDAERVGKLIEKFEEASFPSYKNMSMQASYVTRRLVVVASPENAQVADRWGNASPANVWAEKQAISFGSKPTSGGPFDEVFLIDRSKDPNTPSEVASLLANRNIESNFIIAVRSEDAPNHRMAVLSAPSAPLLRALAKKFNSVDAISTEGYHSTALDIRRDAQPTVVMVISSGDNRELADQIGSQVSSDMRRSLGLDVRERGEVLRSLEKEMTLEQLLGNSEALKKMRDKEGIKRYVWVLSFTSDGHKSYRGEEQRLSGSPQPFSEAEPQEPSTRFPGGHSKSQERIQQERSQYLQDHADWERKRDDYDAHLRTDPVSWQRSLICTSTAHAKGRLLLLDTTVAGKVAWETELEADASNNQTVSQDHVDVRGYDSKPDSIGAPADDGRVSDVVLVDAGRRLGDAGMDRAADELWLPSGPGSPAEVAPTPGPSPEKAAPTRQPATASRPCRIAEVNLPTVVITIESADGIKLGDKIAVPVQTHVVRDPVSHEVLETQVLSQVTLVVTQVFQKTANCKPVPNQKPALLKMMKPGMTASPLSNSRK